VQRHPGGHAEPATVPPIVREILRSPGQPLDAAGRAFFEPRFGHDFSKVRVHTDTRAAESARAVSALAYTVGRDVVFDAGLYAPECPEGRKLLAHELAHVVQQSSASPYSDSRIDPAGSVFESQAGRAAEAVLGSLAPSLTPAPTGGLQRQQAPDDQPTGSTASTAGQQVTGSDLSAATGQTSQTGGQGVAATQSPTGRSAPAHYRFEIKAWIPLAHVSDPEEALHEVAFRLAHQYPESVSSYASEYRGDGHSGYDGSYRVFQVAEFDWDRSRINNLLFPNVPHFGTSHRDFSAVVSTSGVPPTSRLIVSEDTATTDHAVTGAPNGAQEVDLGMSSPNPLTIFPAPNIDADYSFFISQDTSPASLVISPVFGLETVTVRWSTDLMPNHGFRVLRNGAVVKERTVNAIPGTITAPEIFMRLNSKSNGGADTFEPPNQP
jgi:hypothetical protein